MTMAIENLPDLDDRVARQDAFWDCAVIDRPVVSITVPKARPERPYPSKDHATIRERWMDVDYHVESALAYVMNTEYLGDAVPHAMPNLGPEVFSAFFGCELEFGDYTSWSIPSLDSWDNLQSVQFSRDNIYWRKIVAMTDALLKAGRGLFYTGITDLQPGSVIASLRDPHRLNLDMIDFPEEVNKLQAYVTEVYKEVYDFFCDKLTAAGQLCCTWAGIVSTKRWYVPSVDFSCMISPKMFEETFLPGVVAECQHYEASVYHLDGPGAIKHLDALLDIEELNAIQWVWGAGQGRATDWMDIYIRCQKAGKGLQIGPVEPDELDTLMDTLRPEGVWLGMVGIEDQEEAKAVLRRASQW
jgi:hypothetical protein